MTVRCTGGPDPARPPRWPISSCYDNYPWAWKKIKSHVFMKKLKKKIVDMLIDCQQWAECRHNHASGQSRYAQWSKLATLAQQEQ